MRYTYAVESIPNNELVDGSVYCGSCQPGLKPVVSQKIEEGGTGHKFFIPYLVSDCKAILNCTTGGSWVNHCEKCLNGFTWGWNDGLKTVDYSVCIQNDFKFCLAVQDNGDTKTCKVCEKGYEFFNGFCEKTQIPFCGDDYNIF